MISCSLQSNLKTSRMLGGLNNQAGGGATCEAYWRQMPSAFKCLLVSTLALGLFGIFSNLFIYIFADVVIWTVNKFQIWRLLTSFLVDRSIISVIFNLYLINMSFPIVEKMYSTAYSLLEIVIQTLICNVIFILLGEALALLGVINVGMMASFGMMHLLFIFMWQRAAMNPDEMTRFCCFPCVMPMKYLPWCFFAFLLLFSPDFFTIVSCLLGYAQHMVLKRSLLQLPLSYYNKLENLLPNSMKANPGFVAIRSVQVNLRSISRAARLAPSLASGQRNPQQQQGNPFESNDAMNDRVDVVGKGVSIGSSSPVQQTNPADYKKHWLKNLNDEQAQARETDQSSNSHEKVEKKGNLLDFSVEHNETMRSDYPLNDNAFDEELEEQKEKEKSKQQT